MVTGTWYEMTVTFQAKDYIEPLPLSFTTDMVFALNKVFTAHGIDASLFSRTELVPLKARDVQS